MNQQLAASAEQFFRAFEVNSAEGNMEAVVAQFAEVFMAAGPQGEKVVRASDFAAALPRRKQLFASLGCPAASLVSLRQTQLDKRYVMANAKWSFELGGGQSAGRPEEVHVESTYIVNTAAEPFRIVFYLAHQDIVAILKERGMLQG